MSTRSLLSLAVLPQRLSAALVCSAWVLSACGGGGSDSRNPQPEPQPPTPPPVVSKSNVALLAGIIAGVGNLDGTGSAARFNSPRGVALDANGNLYVADSGGHKVRKVTRDGVVTTLAGTGLAGYGNGASGVATFCGPTDVAVDANHNVFVIDNVVVRKISADGVVTTVAGKAPPNCSITESFAPPKNPRGIAVDGAGVFYILSQIPVKVYRLAPGGELTELAGVDQPTADGIGAFGQLFSIAADQAGNVYVSGTIGLGPIAIRKIAPGGAITTVLAAEQGQLVIPALAVDRNGALLYTDAVNHVIWRLLPSGASKRVVSEVQTGNLAADADGSIWFPQNSTVRRADPAGRGTDVAGQPEPSEPNFKGNQVADSAGNVYALAARSAPGLPLVLQRIAPNGSVTPLLEDLSQPQSVAVDAQDSVYLTSQVQIGTICFRGDCTVPIYGTQITKRDTQGRVTQLPRAYRDADGNEIKVERIVAMTFDRAGNLYVANGQIESTAIYRITPAGAIRTVADGKFRISDLAADSQGNVYAPTCDAVNYPTGAQIVRYGADGTTSPLAGTVAVVSGAADGTGAEATFGSCRLGIALDRNDHIFVADTDNHTVRRVSAAGQVSTVVGTAGLQGITLGELPVSLSAPTDVSFDGAGDMYVGSAHAILKVRLGD